MNPSPRPSSCYGTSGALRPEDLVLPGQLYILDDGGKRVRKLLDGGLSSVIESHLCPQEKFEGNYLFVSKEEVLGVRD